MNLLGDASDLLSGVTTYSAASANSEYTAIESDTIGNIINIGGIEFNWNGRRLESIGAEGVEFFSYDYNIDGQRVKKTVTNPDTAEVVTTEYFYNGSILAGQRTGDDVIIFMYDNNGDIFGFTYNGAPYYYVKNAQNDVFLIVDETGTAVVLYQYDAWGNITDCYDTTDFGLAGINPITYRSYYTDYELGENVYYLNSRYYLPSLGRFLCADGYVQTGQGMLDKNMFAYCINNPVNNVDPTGCFWEDVKNWFTKKWNALKDWANDTFGAGSSTTKTLSEIEVPVVPDPWPITVKTGNKTTQTISKHGNSSKPVSVYTNKDVEHPIKSSSAGLILNISKFSLDISLGLDNVGISGSWTEGNTTDSFGLKVNLSELKVGFEGATSIQWDDTTDTAYTNISVNGWAIAAVYIFVTTGQPMPTPSYAY